MTVIKELMKFRPTCSRLKLKHLLEVKPLENLSVQTPVGEITGRNYIYYECKCRKFLQHFHVTPYLMSGMKCHKHENVICMYRNSTKFNDDVS